MSRRRHLLFFAIAGLGAVLAVSLLLVLPESVDVLGARSRSDRAVLVQTLLTAGAVMLALVGLLIELGPPPVLQLTLSTDGGMMRVHYVLAVTPVRHPITGVRLEVRLQPELNAAQVGALGFDSPASGTESKAWREVYASRGEQQVLVGWDLEKSRIEPAETVPDLYFNVYAEHPKPTGLLIRWWSARTGPTQVWLFPDTEPDSVKSKGS